MKPGYRTTEFWVTLGVQLGNLAAALDQLLPAKDAAIVSAVAGGLYALSRGWAKSAAVPSSTSDASPLETVPAPEGVHA